MSDVLDEVDRAILRILVHDGRTPAAQIAEEIGLSRPSVSERIEKLERGGIIRGITAVVDPAALGRSITAFISARHSGPMPPKVERAFRSLVSRDEILEVHAVAGDDCYLMKVRTDSIRSLNAIVNTLAAAPISMTTRTTIVMDTYCEKVSGVNLRGGK